MKREIYLMHGPFGDSLILTDRADILFSNIMFPRSSYKKITSIKALKGNDDLIDDYVRLIHSCNMEIFK
jgi:hypothetical protein